MRIARRRALGMIALLIAGAIVFVGGLSKAAPPYEGVLRLHVIANSDCALDQAAKLAVRDAVLQSGGLEMNGADSCDSAEAALMADGETLYGVVEQALRGAGMEYGFELRLGTYCFPERDYGGVRYPAGDYRALRIVLGEGAGKNWWCVLFPPLCILKLDDGEIDYEKIRTNSYLIKLIKSIDGGRLWEKIEEKLR